MEEMKNAYLKRRDANVFIVDWGKGAIKLSYLQATANTRIAGAELKRYLTIDCYLRNGSIFTVSFDIQHDVLGTLFLILENEVKFLGSPGFNSGTSCTNLKCKIFGV